MSCTICSVFLFVSFVYGVFGQTPYLEEYYWREYEGVTPKDALAGGLDRNGRPIYIGQALFDNKLVPGKIYVNDENVHFAWDNENLSNRNVKILCTPRPENFKWIRTNSRGVSLLTNTILIKGGFQPDYSTYIGRVLHDGETCVGKVICGVNDCLGLYIAINGKQLVYQDFDILSYSQPSPRNPHNCSDNPILDVFSKTTQ